MVNSKFCLAKQASEPMSPKTLKFRFPRQQNGQLAAAKKKLVSPHKKMVSPSFHFHKLMSPHIKMSEF